ncbi:diguanylate cyclase [Solemya pervernicosa gill symbiont]|nr:diguanylate cyclase [Solemya pervernicosa gill symbiont]
MNSKRLCTAVMSPAGEDLKEIIQRADITLYKAKANGRNGSAAYNEDDA